MCNYIDEDPGGIGAVRNTIFYYTNNDGEYNCNTNNVVYLISCSNCSYKYVRQTSRKLKIRVLEHLNKVKNYDDHSSHNYLYKHFATKHHQFKVKILEKVEDNRNLLDAELFWIKLLTTIFPFGLNDSIKGYGNISNKRNSDNCPYFDNVIPRWKRPRGNRKNHTVRNTLSDLEALIKNAVDSPSKAKKVYIVT